MIYLVDLEYVETRYTAEWKTFVPEYLRTNGLDVCIISGPDNIAACTTPGAFLNFSGTNVYKAEQVKIIAELFSENKIKEGDKFLFTDAWHPGVINVKYMSELLGVKVELHGLWHAGSYDPADFLGRLIGDAPWVRHAEKSFYECYDKNWFASEFHIEMFVNTIVDNDDPYDTLPHPELISSLRDKVQRTGWPFEYLDKKLENNIEKENIILFPHRMAPEKQPDIFKSLAEHLPEYEFIFCQDLNLSKAEYHNLLKRAKMVFSANTQETLGISCYEILCAGGMPLVPNRLSYVEMYEDVFKYPDHWTDGYKSYVHHLDVMKDKIKTLMDNFDTPEIQDAINRNKQTLGKEYFSAYKLLQHLGGK
tara:strand:- start:276 stop:1367 length:1092 start_codon:yes stop_codon:yes gene_type:complete